LEKQKDRKGIEHGRPNATTQAIAKAKTNGEID
jgi:hypothetical protein